MQKDFSPNFISLQQASEISGYHQDYLSQLIRQGKIKGTKIGRNWFVAEEQIKTLSASQKEPFSNLKAKWDWKLILLISILVILIASVFVFQKITSPKSNILKPTENEQPLF